MKYEYLKGSEKDFEGAPDWCTHISKIKSDGGLLAWEQADASKKGNLYQWCNGVTSECVYEQGGTQFDIIAERQPITEPSWDGVGLPPVGCECEFTFGPYEPDEFDVSCGETPIEGTIVNVVEHKTTSHGNKVAVVYWDDAGAGRAMCLIGPCLKPIRAEEDKKRDYAVGAMERCWEAVTDNPAHHFEEIYDAIAAGKIPGVKLED